MKVFLGGTCNESEWRDAIIPKLSIDYYNPVKDEWSEEAFQEEIQAKLDCNYFLYCLTPRYTGYFSFAEVINESFHYSNQTIFCFLNEDGDHIFSKEETESLKELGSRVVENGGLWLENLEEVATFLNSTQEDRIQLNKYDFFISYGRKHSSSLASKLNHSFIKEGKTVWMDKFCIPTGVDFQMSINDGITKSDNFIYIISPHSVQSEYCTKELEVALKYGKRIIPLLHVMEPGLEELMHPEIQKLNWFYFDSERKFQHGFTELIKTTSTDPGYLEANTKWLQKAVEWDSQNKNLAYANLIWKISDNFELGSKIRYVGSMYSEFIIDFDDVTKEAQGYNGIIRESPNYFICDVQLSIVQLLNKRLRIDLNGKNLLGANFRIPFQQNNAWANRGMTGRGRWFMLTAKYSF